LMAFQAPQSVSLTSFFYFQCLPCQALKNYSVTIYKTYIIAIITKVLHTYI